MALAVWTSLYIMMLCLVTFGGGVSAQYVLQQFENELQPGSSLDIHCNVSIHKVKEFKWTFEELEIATVTGQGPSLTILPFENQDEFQRRKYNVNKQNTSDSDVTVQTLTVLHVTPNSTGTYRCGSSETVIRVSPTYQVSAVIGSNATLVCDGAGALYSQSLLEKVLWYLREGDNEQLILQWNRDGVPVYYAAADRKNYVLESDRITVHSRSGGQFMYRCTMSMMEDAIDPNATVPLLVEYSWTINLTVQEKPNAPGIPYLVNSTSGSLLIGWNASLVSPSRPLTSYTLQSMKCNAVEKGWDSDLTKSFNNLVELSFWIPDLSPSTCYAIRLKSVNVVGENASTFYTFETNQTVPDAPIIGSAMAKTHQITLEWNHQQRSKITGFLITVYLKANMSEILKKEVPSTYSSFEVTNLTALTMYCYKIQAKNSAGVSPAEGCIEKSTDIAAPDEPPKILEVSQPELINHTGEVSVHFNHPNCFYEDPSCLTEYQLGYRAVNATDWTYQRITIDEIKTAQSSTKYYTLSGLAPEFAYEIKMAGVVRSIYFSKNNILTYTGRFSNSSITSVVKAIVVDPTTTENVPVTAEQKNDMTTIIIVIVVCIVVLVAAVIVIVVVMRMKRSRESNDSDSNTDYWIELNTPLLNNTAMGYVENDYENIGIDQWAEHVKQMHANTDIKFTEEYDSICKAGSFEATWTNSLEPSNVPKNRYNNIVAYDATRVILKTLPGVIHSDYINANYVDSYDKQKAFIATQGPLPNTIDDFWRMVWENNVSVIVMITNVYEKHKKKCEQYWPNEGDAQYGRLTVQHLGTEEMAYWTIRRFVVKNSKVSKKKHQIERNIEQYHYTDWPDHGVPEYTLPVLAFIRRSSAASPYNGGPIVVHCSAGVGRTGTYIVLESMMKQIMQKRTVNVQGFLRHIRTQRNTMVQTEDQYIFIHDALVNFIESGARTDILPRKLGAIMDELDSNFDSSGETILEKQYKNIVKWKPNDFLLQCARLEVNKPKNRSEAFIPLDNLSRVKLPKIPGEDGSDYINATYLHGYFQNQEFVVTQHPSAKTEFDFWRMVWDQNSMTIVMLSNLGEEDLITFYRPKGESTDWDHRSSFKLTFTEDNLELLDYTIRDFRLESKQDDYEMVTRMFSITCWPEAYSGTQQYSDGVFQFIEAVNRWHEKKRNQAGPIIVIDKYGGKTAAQFCALYSLFNQYKKEKQNVVDIYSLAYLYHRKRPGVWETQDDYRFLYNALTQLCEAQSSQEKGIDGLSSDIAGETIPTTFANVRRINTLTRSPDNTPRIETL